MSSQSPISSFYRIWFTRLDPIMTISGIYFHVVNPLFLLAGLNPNYKSPPAPETILLLDQGAAWFLSILILQLGLLRSKPNDVTVWWYYAAAVGTVDVLTCGAIVKALSAQGRSDVGDWRTEEWVNLGMTAACAVVRGAFVLGLGVGEEDLSAEKTKK